MNLTKFFKSGIATLIILALGLVLLFTMNFNKSFDYTGGTMISINTTEFEIVEAKNKVNEVLAENDLRASFISAGENDMGDCLIVKYQIFENINKTNEKVRNDLFETFNYDSADILEEKYITMQTNAEPAYGAEIFIKAFLASLVAVVAVALYMVARHNLTSGFVMIAVAILDLGIMLSLTIIARIPISHYVGLAILGTIAVSISMSFLILNRINKNANDEKNVSLNNSQLVDMSAKENKNRNLYFGLAFIAALILIAIWVDGTASFMLLALILGILGCVFSSYYITPTLWARAYFRKIKKQKTTQEKSNTKKDMGMENLNDGNDDISGTVEIDDNN